MCIRDSQCHLKIHLFTHEDVKPYICAVCPKRFYAAGHLKRHQSVHSDYKQFICGLCNKLFKGKSAVQIHFKKCCTLLEFDWWICIYVIFCVFMVNYSWINMCALYRWMFTVWCHASEVCAIILRVCVSISHTLLNLYRSPAMCNTCRLGPSTLKSATFNK